MAYVKQNYLPGDVLTAEQVNKIQDAILTNEGNINGHLEDKNNPHGVTREQLQAAPSGHGLGTTGQLANDWNTTVKSGFYYGNKNAPDSGWWCGAVYGNGNNYAFQHLFKSDNPSLHKIREMSNGTWGNWVDCGPSAFAPAGYGLGANLFKQGPHLTSLEQLNITTKTGWYSLFASPSTINNITFDCAVIEVISYIDGRTTQKLYPITNNLSNNTMLIRHSWNDAWGEWDCENAPMALGVEYRTTERWNGRAVYTCLVNYGKAPNNDSGSVNHNLTVVQPIRCTAHMGEKASVPYEAWGEKVNASFGKTSIYVASSYNASAYDVYVQCWYTKD